LPVINPSIIGCDNFDKVKKYCRKRLNFPPVQFLNWNDVEQLLKLGHEIGSHTMEHINIANAPEDLIIEDMQKTYEILKRKCGEIKHFAFPYGRFSHFNEIGRKAVFNAGFKSCASAERGCHINHHEELSRKELCIRRDHMILDWDIEHIKFFIAKNSKFAEANNNLYPYDR